MQTVPLNSEFPLNIFEGVISQIPDVLSDTVKNLKGLEEPPKTPEEVLARLVDLTKSEVNAPVFRSNEIRVNLREFDKKMEKAKFVQLEGEDDYV